MAVAKCISAYASMIPCVAATATLHNRIGRTAPGTAQCAGRFQTACVLTSASSSTKFKRTLPQANPAAPCTIHNVRSLQQSVSTQRRHRSRVKRCCLRIALGILRNAQTIMTLSVLRKAQVAVLRDRGNNKSSGRFRHNMHALSYARACPRCV